MKHGKKKGGAARILLGIAVVILAAVVLVTVLVMREIKGTGDAGETVVVSIEPGSGPSTIANALQEAGMIDYPFLFRQYLKLTGTAGGLQYGDFTLTQGMGYDAIIEALSQYAKADTVTLTFPEGSTALAIAGKMEEAGLCTADEFLEEANNGDFSEFSFWNKIETHPNCFMKCEGYLFPNTYEFLVDDTVHNYVATFYREFDRQMTDDLYQRMDEMGMSLEDTIILASFVQEEAGNEESANVSAVFHNRLQPDSPITRLESNASSYVQNPDDNNYLYNWVAPYYGGWDNIPTEIYNAYNTYEVEGLPAGPISNPGIESIKAALYPTENFPYYFFVTDLTGKYYYARTADEHNANCQTAWAVNASLPD